MELRQITTFIRVAQFESFSKAAASLGYSQSAVTVQIRQLEDAVENIKYNINLQKIAVVHQQKKTDQARNKLNDAMKERKTYEKLKERAFEEFKKEVNAEEQKEINELVSFRFGQGADREG